IPVLTGIGHSTNETVSEMVSFKNAITPSELADFLIQKFHNFAIPLDQAREKLISNATAIFVQEREVLHRAAQQLAWSSGNLLTTERHQLHLFAQRLQLFSRHFLKEQYANLAHIQKIVQMADPKLLLKKGYSITLVGGKALQ